MTPRPLLPFPSPFHVGTDVCHIVRIHNILASPRGPRFIRRVLAEEELVRPRSAIAEVLGADPSGANSAPKLPRLIPENGSSHQPPTWEAAVFIAGRFAAKEAIIKAHPHRRLTFHDIVIQKVEAHQSGRQQHLGSGPPVAIVRGAHDGVADQEARISISHDGDYAVAMCLGFEPACAPQKGPATSPSAFTPVTGPRQA